MMNDEYLREGEKVLGVCSASGWRAVCVDAFGRLWTPDLVSWLLTAGRYTPSGAGGCGIRLAALDAKGDCYRIDNVREVQGRGDNAVVMFLPPGADLVIELERLGYELLAVEVGLLDAITSGKRLLIERRS